MYHSCDIHYFFFFNDTATTEIYTLSLHDALPISAGFLRAVAADEACSTVRCPTRKRAASRYLPAKLERSGRKPDWRFSRGGKHRGSKEDLARSRQSSRHRAAIRRDRA